MRISIDAERCTGHGRCYVEAPELFGDDDRGYGQVIGDGDVAIEHRDAARRAAIICPEQAVLIADPGLA